ncbi:MAG: tol-pal system protein YbgF [Alphaproteobacteria bacterium]|nr:tol-pal system protein YbgF [Alphaproteobacteria bacterium]
MNRRFLKIGAPALFGLLLAAPVLAQSPEVGSLLDRLNRLERDLQTLQREVYRGETPPAASGSVIPAPSPADTSTQAARAELRFTELESQIRDLTGRVEEVQFELTKLNERLDRLTGDLELRLGALERGGAPAGTETGYLAVPPPGSSPPKTGGLPPAPATVPSALPVEEVATQAASLPPKEAYNHAFSLLSRREYAAAERELKAFLEAYPNDPLAGNATYWLGETHYVRNDFRQAAVTFLEGYQKDPKGTKAADNLLKLAKSLGNVGEKKEACATLDRLKKEFPDASATIKQSAVAERKRSGCS